jgi:hypothetical protein
MLSGALVAGNYAGPCRILEDLLGGRIRYVDAVSGNDNNEGTAKAPWKTIGKAASTLNAGESVIVKPGVYRESIAPRNSGTSEQTRINYIAYDMNNTVISGADVLTGWMDGGNGIYYRTWPVAFPQLELAKGDDTPDYVSRQELLIFDGKMMTPRNTKAELTDTEVSPATEFFAGGEYWLDVTMSPSRVYAKFPKGMDPAGHVVEGSVRPTLWRPDKRCDWLRVVGFKFVYAASTRSTQTFATRFGSNLLIEENVFLGNNAWGVSLSGNRSTWRGNKILYNGQLGFGGGPNYSTVSFLESAYNNWKGYDAPYEAGGSKLAGATDSQFDHLDIHDNLGPGLWFDGGSPGDFNDGNVVRSSRSYRNMMANYDVELSSNTSFINCVAFDAKPIVPPFSTAQDPKLGAGFYLTRQTATTLIHCTSYGNSKTGLEVRDYNGRNPPYDNLHNRIYNSIFAFNRAEEISLGGDNQAEARNNELDGNIYWDLNGDLFTVINPRKAGHLFQGRSIADWRTYTGQDANSQEVDPGLTDRAAIEGWHLSGSSRARGMGVVAPVPVPDDANGNPRPGRGADVGADQYVTNLNHTLAIF